MLIDELSLSASSSAGGVAKKAGAKKKPGLGAKKLGAVPVAAEDEALDIAAAEKEIEKQKVGFAVVVDDDPHELAEKT